MSLAIDLSGKTILVCGIHKGGIGGATCRQIAKAGGAIVALDKDQSFLDDIAREIKALGGKVHTVLTDLLDVAQCEKVIPRILADFGPIDGVANIAGGTRAEEWMPLEDTPAASFRHTMQLNFEYVFYICRDAAKEWIKTGRPGAIVNVASISAKDAAPWHGPYGAGKSAITALTRTMAKEWHEFGIRANCVSPGGVMTERVTSKGGDMSAAAKAARDPASRTIWTEANELANAITFLLSDLASGVSGQNLTVDRSLSAKFCAFDHRTRKEIADIVGA